MNTNSDFLSSGDEQLRSLLREARPAADLPPDSRTPSGVASTSPNPP